MDIIVPFSIRKKELTGEVSDEAKKLFVKIKASPALAVSITAKGLPERTTLHKVYATTPDGARRLLFFCRHAPPLPGKPTADSNPPRLPSARWVLLFYRTKGDDVGDNMSHKNRAFVIQLERNLTMALEDLLASTPAMPLFEQF